LHARNPVIFAGLITLKIEELTIDELIQITMLDEKIKMMKIVVDELFKRGNERDGWNAFKNIFDKLLEEDQLGWIPYVTIKNEEIREEIKRFLVMKRDDLKSTDTIKAYAAIVLYYNFDDDSSENCKYILAVYILDFGKDWFSQLRYLINDELSRTHDKALDLLKLRHIKETWSSIGEFQKARNILAEKVARGELAKLTRPGELELFFLQDKIDMETEKLKSKQMKLTYSGNLRFSLEGRLFPIRCFDTVKDVVVIQKESKLFFLEFRKNTFVKLSPEIALPLNHEDICWTVGDIDGDGREEIILGNGKLIELYKWKPGLFGGSFRSQAFQTKQSIVDLVCGDIDNEIHCTTVNNPSNKIYNLS